MKNIVLYGSLFLAFFVASSFTPVKKQQAEKISSSLFHNFYKVSAEVYRSEQPSAQGMREIEKQGIRTVLCLRNWHDDKDEAEGTSLITERVPINTSEISYSDIFAALKIIKQSPKPVLVHCWHGSDRTGCIIASYRMVFENWSKEEAIAEFKQEEFGYHNNVFPNILVLLQSLDVARLRSDLGIK